METYERLFELPKMQYFEGSPVILRAGALLRCIEDSALLIQLKFSSVSEKIIKAVIISIEQFDVMGTKIRDLSFQYLDLSCKKYDSFGEQTAIEPLSAALRKFSVRLLTVVYQDDTVWQNNDNIEFIPLPEEEKIDLPECLLSQFRRCVKDTSRVLNYWVQETGALWMCGCGEWSMLKDDVCHNCSLSRTVQEKYHDLALLEEVLKNQREKEEQRAEETRRWREKQKRKKQEEILKILRCVIFILISILLLDIAFILFFRR